MPERRLDNKGVSVILHGAASYTHPFRLDMDWRWCKYAKERGVKIVIDPDAHEEEGLMDIYFGVGIARKGWLEPGDVFNTMDLEEMKDFLKRRKPSK